MAEKNLQRPTPRLALVTVTTGDNSSSTKPWAKLTGVPDEHIFALPLQSNSLVASYIKGLRHLETKDDYDVILFVGITCPETALQTEAFTSTIQHFWGSPRTMCMGLIGQNGAPVLKERHSKEAALPYEFNSIFSLECFAVKAEEIKRIGFLCADFKYDEGAVEEYAFRQLKAGQLPSISKVCFFGSTSSSPQQVTANRRQQSNEFAARYFVENRGRDWDLVISSYLPIDLQKTNHFTHQRNSWEKFLSDHERSLYARTLYTEEYKDVLSIGNTIIATRLHGIVRLMSLQEAAEALNPWYYYLELGNHNVTPGINGLEPAKALDDRKVFMERMLIDRVVGRYDFRGKNILDAGSNCGFFSAIYAQNGAVSFTGIEGRVQHVHQGQLYWGTNEFLEGSHYEFIHANIDENETWSKIDARGNFDFTLCAGLLYHLPNPIETLRKLARRTREVIVVDSRVSNETKVIKEPGGCSFDAIVQTREKINPSLANLINVLKEEGFEVENITANEQMTGDVPTVDNYNKGNRVSLYAERQR